MSDSQDDSDDAFMFAFAVVGSPFCIFALALLCSSSYLHWTAWRPFWKRYTETLPGRVRQRVELRRHYADDGSGTTTQENIMPFASTS
mgnify:CR=1 FL=1